MEKHSIEAKRGRKKVIVDERDANRLRSQRHRANKKEYYKKLEDEVKELTERVRVLDCQVEHYKNLLLAHGISEKSSEIPEFISDEHYHWNGLAKTITETPELVKVSMHMQLWDKSGIRSESRQKFIKKAFRSIINHIIPVGLTVPSIILKNIDNGTLDLLEKYKTYKYKKSEFINEYKLNKVQQILFDQNDADSTIKLLIGYTHLIDYVNVEIKEAIHDLVRLQNKLLNMLEKTGELLGPIFEVLKLEDFNRVVLLYTNFIKKEFLDPKYLWSIPNKVEGQTDDLLYLSD